MPKRRPSELSGGQQRTALARAIARESRATFLDEPLSILDCKLHKELREQLPELFAGRGVVFVYVTSEPEEAPLLGGATARMEDSRVAQLGPTAEIHRNPGNIAAVRVFSDAPINLTEIRKEVPDAVLGTGCAGPCPAPPPRCPTGPIRWPSCRFGSGPCARATSTCRSPEPSS